MAENIRNFGLSVFAVSLTLSIAGANAGWALLLLGVLMEPSLRGDFFSKIKGNSLFRPWIAYLAAGFLSCLFGLDPFRSLLGLRSDFLKAFVYFLLVASLTQGITQRVAKFFLAGAGVAAGLGVFQVLYGYFASGELLWAHGTMHHVTYGELMALSLAFSFSLVLFPRVPSRGIGLLSALVGAALILSQTRGAWLGAAATLGSFFVFYPLARKKILILGACFLFGLGGVFWMGRRTALVSALSERAASIFSTSPDPQSGAEMSRRARFVFWEVGLEIFKDHPIFGVGKGNVRKVRSRYHPEPVFGEKDWGNLHSLYIHQLAERGIIGFFALLYLLFSMFHMAWDRFRSAPNSYSLCALAVLPGFFVMNLTETSFQHAVIAFTMLWILAMAQAPHSVAFLKKGEDFEDFV